MVFYRYLVKTKDGKALREVADADSKEELVNRLRSEDFFIVSIEEAELEEPGSAISKFFSGKIFALARGKSKHSSSN